jgi:hypothetical protein
MGPFKTGQHGFRFNNAFEIEEENVAQVRRRATREIVERSLEIAAFGPIRQALRLLRIPLPLAPDLELPAFVISSVMEIVIPRGFTLLIDKIGGSIPGTFGRCGGMAFAGHDFYLLDWPVDERLGTTPPNNGPLGEYIFERLLDSLELNIGMFLEWVARLHILPLLSEAATIALLTVAGNLLIPPLGAAVGAFIGTQVDIFDLGGKKPLLADTKNQWAKLKQILDEQAAWPVGLIFGHSAIPWDQHQILAVGYQDNGNGGARLFAWDNNEPLADKAYDLDFRGSELLSKSSSTDPEIAKRDATIKGLFVESYKPRVPPLELKLS